MKLTAQLLKHSATTLVGLGLVTAPAHAAVLVSPTNDATTLSNNILGSGINISKVTYSGAASASGTFSGGSSAGIGINTGIIMTTGDANTAGNGTNDSPGDADLSNLISGATTNDAASLSIDFTTQGGDLFFNYVFASEEYNEYVNSQYNDVFGFFLDGKNIALLPGTTTPVAINTVNGGNPIGTSATNPSLYNNNNPANFDTGYDGFTKVLTAQALNLTPGTHSIKLAIADTGDTLLDSAVFIQGNSFADTPVAPTPGGAVPATEVPFDFSPGLGILIIGVWGAIAQLKSKVQKWKSCVSAFSKN